MAAIENISTNEIQAANDLYDEISKRISQARAIGDCLGNLREDGGSLRDDSPDGAAWAIKDLLTQAEVHARALLEIATRRQGDSK